MDNNKFAEVEVWFVQHKLKLRLLQLLAHAALRAPPEGAFAMCSWPLLLATFGLSFSFLRLLCENLFPPIF